MSRTIPDIHSLLAHADWLDRLTRQLCRDRHEAEDVAQATVLALLARKPAHAANLRGMLAKVARNVWLARDRAARRRVARERRVASAQRVVESAVDTVQRAELQQRLGALVLALPEPQRSTVLLHYFDGESVAAIARRRGTTTDAVHGHLRRARETLRWRLCDDDPRPLWRGAAVLFAGWVRSSVVVMSLHKKVGVVVAIVVALSCWAVFARGDHDASPAAPSDPRVPSTFALDDVELPAASIDQVERSPVETATAPSATATASSAMAGSLTGRVIDPSGTAFHPARVYVVPMVGEKISDSIVLRADVDEHGEFVIVPSFDGDALIVAIPLAVGSRGLHAELLAVAARVALDRQEDRHIELQLAAAVTIDGVVRDPLGPVVGVEVGWYPTDVTFGTILDGEFAVSGLPGGGVHVERVKRSGGSSMSGGAAVDATGHYSIATAQGRVGYLFLVNPAGPDHMELLVGERRVVAPARVDFDLLAPACVCVRRAGEPAVDTLVTVEFALDGRSEPRRENYRTNRAGELRILRERLVPLRGSIRRAGRERLDFDIPMESTPADPRIVELDPLPTVPIAVHVTSERPIRTLAGSLSRRDGVGGAFSLRVDESAAACVLRGAAPPGAYRLTLSVGRGVEGDDMFVLPQSLEVDLTDAPEPIVATVEHGGRIGVTVVTSDGRHAPGSIRLQAPDGSVLTPSMRGQRGNGEAGSLWAPERLVTALALLPGRYEVVIEHRGRGMHREVVEVSACQVAEVAVEVR